MKQPKVTRERLVAAVNGAISIRQVLIRLDVAPYGGNYGVLRRALSRHDIDTSQFVGRAWSLCPNCHALTPTYRSERRIGA